MISQSLDPAIISALHALNRRGLALPALCLVASHRPLAFVASQLLYGVAPVAALLGQPACNAWAALLSDPAGVAQLEQCLTTATLSITATPTLSTTTTPTLDAHVLE